MSRTTRAEPAEVTLTAALPQGWTERTGAARYPVAAHDVYPVQAAAVAPSSKGPEWQEVTYRAEANGKPVGSVTLRVNVTSGGGLPQ